MDQSIAPHNRRSRRSPVLLAATIEVAGAAKPVKLRNLSEKGVLIEGDTLPAEDSRTVFERRDLRVSGRVVWVEGCYAGVAFDQPLNTEEVLRHIPKARPKARQDFRRPGLACRPLTDYERRMLGRWMTSSPMGELGE